MGHAVIIKKVCTYWHSVTSLEHLTLRQRHCGNLRRRPCNSSCTVYKRHNNALRATFCCDCSTECENNNDTTCTTLFLISWTLLQVFFVCCWPCILVIFDFVFQLNALLVYYIFSSSSICFEPYRAHHQDGLLYIHSIWFFMCHSS
jgi:hypothetical protein